MKKDIINILLGGFLVSGVLITGCTKEIDFDYNEMDPIVVVEGRLTNEGATVMITKSRSVTDSVKGRCLTGADVHILAEGIDEKLTYHPVTKRYESTLKGVPGTTYRLTVDFEGKHYEGTSTMTAPAPILTTQFLWQEILEERLLAYEVLAIDPDSLERNHFWYRMDRITHHPHFKGKDMSEPYRWGIFTDRGNPPGKILRDVTCMSEKAAEEDEEENWKGILYEGDTIIFQLMTLDLPSYEFYSTLRAGQGGGANPRSNLTGGCQGCFVAGSVTRADTVVFSYSKVGTFKGLNLYK